MVKYAYWLLSIAPVFQPPLRLPLSLAHRLLIGQLKNGAAMELAYYEEAE